MNNHNLFHEIYRQIEGMIVWRLKNHHWKVYVPNKNESSILHIQNLQTGHDEDKKW